MSSELYKRYRPKTLAEVVGQDVAVKTLDKMLKDGKVPRSVLFTGPSGTGKTTLARILKDRLGCGDWDFEELNSAKMRGIDTVRKIDRAVNFSPTQGKCRIWLLDEVHQITKDAQEALLKLLEDTPKHVYFFLATTEPGKLIKPILTRCTQIALTTVQPKAVRAACERVLKAEKAAVSGEVLDEVVNAAEGSVRKALVLLGQVLALEDADDQLTLVRTAEEVKTAAFDLVRMLLWQKVKWPDMAKTIRGLTDTDWEGMRRLILTNAANEVLKGGKNAARANFVLECFTDNWYDSGKAGLVSSCYNALHG